MSTLSAAYNPDSALREQLFRLIFENAATGIAQIDRHGHFLTVNDKVAEITGYSKEELLQKTFQEITHPDDLETDVKQAEAMYRGEISSYTMEKRYIKKDGSTVWIKLTGSAVFDESGIFEMFVGIIDDISDKKKTEEALHKSLQHYKIASVAAKIGAYYRNVQTGEDHWSPEFLALYGLKPGEALPLKDNIPQAVHPDDRESVLNLAQQHYDQSNNTEFTSDHRIILPDGSFRWVNVRGITERDLQKNPVATYGIAMDITARKEAEMLLQENEKKFRTLANNISQLVWMSDNKGQVFWFNQRWLDYTGTSAQKLMKWGWKKIIHPAHLRETKKSINRALKTGEAWEEIIPLKNKEGEYRWFLARAIPVNSEEDKPRWFGTATDITRQRETEGLIKKDKDLIENLLFIAAHDLKGPVGNMYGVLNLMDDFPAEKKLTLLEHFRKIAGQLDKTITGITDILRVRNTDISGASVVHIEGLLYDLLPEFRDELNPESVHPDFVMKPSVRYIEPFLYSILKNLISNSIKYRRDHIPLHIGISTKREGIYTLLTYSDNGIGIDLNKYDKKLFSPFQRLEVDKASGTGIGLYLIKTIIEKNGGYIKVESTPGEGTTFYCYLKEYM